MAKFTLSTFVPAEKANEWDEAITALIESQTALDADENTPENTVASIEVTLPVKDEAKELRAFRAAAKAQNKTVRIRKRDDSAVTKVGVKENGKAILEGDVALVLSLVDKYKDGRGRKPASETAPTEAAKPKGK